LRGLGIFAVRGEFAAESLLVAGFVAKMLHSYFLFFLARFSGEMFGVSRRSRTTTQHHLIITMKKTILALALVAGLTLYTGNAKAETIVTTLNEDMTKFSIFSYQISQNSVTGANPGEGFSVGGYNAKNYQQGYYFSGGMSFVQTGEEYWEGYYNFYKMSSFLLQLGSTIDGSTSFKSNDYDYNDGNPFTGKIYQGFRADVEGNTYYGYIQGTGNGGTTWTLDSISFNSTPGASVTVIDTTEAIPEPSTYALFGIGAIGMLMVMRRKKTA